MKVQNDVSKLKTSQNKNFKKNEVLKDKSFSKQKRFSNKFSKKNNDNRKPIFKQSLFHKDVSKKKDFVIKSPFVQKYFRPNLPKNEGFHVSKCICHYCNKIGHFTGGCPIKRNMHFGAKMVWVPKTNHEGPKTKRVPNTT